MRRIFVVGCARSGTTLVQGLLGAHPGAVTFPETHFFTKLVGDRGVLRRLGIALPGARGRLVDLFRELGVAETEVPAPRLPLVSSYTRAFSDGLDRRAEADGKAVWVEKTPYHLRRIDTIERHVPSAHFVHVVRGGPRVVASLYEVTRAHPVAWRRVEPRTLYKEMAGGL